MNLRPYQVDAVARLRAEYAQGQRRLCLVAATGSGKTVIGCHLIQEAVRKGQRALWLAHRTELIEQASARLEALGIRHGIIKAGYPATPAPVQVASVQTLGRRKLPEASVVFVDEAHHVRATSWGRILAGYPEAPIIGLTATPYRLDGRGLGQVFDALVQVASVRQLVSLGFLVEPEVYAAPPPDLSGVHVRNGEFVAEEVQFVMDRSELVGNVVETYQRLGLSQSAVVFAAGVQHSKHLRQRFEDAGIAVEHVDGDTPASDRAATLERFRSGATRVLCNVQIFTEGVDLPLLAIAVLARPTKSLGLYLQMIGRIMRPYQGKRARVLDHAGNAIRHGLPTDEIEFSLADRVKRRAGEAPLKNCPECFRVCAISVRICPECGHEFIPEREEPKEKAGELVLLNAEKRRIYQENGHDPERVYAQLRAMGAARGYRPGWAAYQFKARFKRWPRKTEFA